jgi:hypothetical protein
LGAKYRDALVNGVGDMTDGLILGRYDISLFRCCIKLPEESIVIPVDDGNAALDLENSKVSSTTNPVTRIALNSSKIIATDSVIVRFMKVMTANFSVVRCALKSSSRVCF